MALEGVALCRQLASNVTKVGMLSG
jgi:hypothetical protein